MLKVFMFLVRWCAIVIGLCYVYDEAGLMTALFICGIMLTFEAIVYALRQVHRALEQLYGCCSSPLGAIGGLHKLMSNRHGRKDFDAQ